MKYLNNIKEQEFIDFLNENGLFLYEQNGQEWGRDDCENYYFKCFCPKSDSKNLIMDKLRESNSNTFFDKVIKYSSFYSFNQIQLYSVNDFMLSRLIIDDSFNEFDIKLQQNFHKFMISKFNQNGQYIKDYDSFVDDIEKEI